MFLLFFMSYRMFRHSQNFLYFNGDNKVALGMPYNYQGNCSSLGDFCIAVSDQDTLR
jgi:hypothetical protein